MQRPSLAHPALVLFLLLSAALGFKVGSNLALSVHTNPLVLDTTHLNTVARAKLGLPFNLKCASVDALLAIPGIGRLHAEKLHHLAKQDAELTWNQIDKLPGIGAKRLAHLKTQLELTSTACR